MAPQTLKKTERILSLGMVFRYHGRVGEVFLVRDDAADVLWQEKTDTRTGEVLEKCISALTDAEVHRADIAGCFRILWRKSGTVNGAAHAPRLPTEKELERQRWRLAYISAAEDLIAKGMGTTRQAFKDNADRILADGLFRYTQRLEEATDKRSKAGKRLKRNDTFEPVKCAATVHGWWKEYQRRDRRGLLDNYFRSGNRTSRYPSEVVALAKQVVDSRLDEERPTVASIYESVKAAFYVQYAIGPGDPLPESTPCVPGYDFVHDLIDRLAPVDHQIRTRGFKTAYADLHAIGMGMEVTRPLERVMIDEYDVDLMVFLRDDTGILRHLPPELVEGFQLDGAPKRLRVSAAIDSYTRCILGMKFALGKRGAMLAETLEMIMTDKGEFSDGVGAMTPWSQFGRPETLVPDRDPVYASDSAADLLAALGVTNFGPPSRKPWLRAFIERFFRTFHQTFLNRLSGRTFGSIGAKGANEPEARASLTLDDFLTWCVRWLVEIYHASPHSGLSTINKIKICPAQKWEAATAIQKVSVVSRPEMRLVFGVRVWRKLSNAGIRVMNVQYQSDALMAHFHGSRLDGPLEVAWWPGDIGAIELRLSQSEWLTVPALDGFFWGKTLNDLIVMQARGQELALSLHDMRMRSIHELDQTSLKRKAVLGLLATRVETPEQLQKLEQRFSRFMVTAERQNRTQPARDLFADPVGADDEDGAPNPELGLGDELSPPRSARPYNPDDVMD